MNQVYDFIKKLIDEYVEDDISTEAAALAFFTVFSLSPLLMISIAIAGWIFGPEAVQGKVYGELTGTLGPDIARTVEEIIKSAGTGGGSVTVTLYSAGVILFAASRIFQQLRYTFTNIWKMPRRPMSGTVKYIKRSIFSVLMVFGFAILLIFLLILSLMSSALSGFLEIHLPFADYITNTISFITGALSLTIIFALLYKYFPDAKIKWKDVWPGSILTAALYIFGQYFLNLYFLKKTFDTVYGAAGSFVVLTFWVYYLAQIIYVGVEFTKVWSFSYGTLKEQYQATQAAAQIAKKPHKSGRAPKK